MGKLYLNATILREDPSTASCGRVRHYGMEPVHPTNNTTKKAYFSQSFITAGSCDDTFEFNVTESFRLTGNATVHFFFGCDDQTIIRAAPGQSTVRLALVKNGTEISTGMWTSSAATCSGTTRTSANVTLNTRNTFYNASDILALKVRYFADSDDDTNVHFKVESRMQNSSIRATGLPIPLPPPEPNATASPNATTPSPTSPAPTTTVAGSPTTTTTSETAPSPTETSPPAKPPPTQSLPPEADDGGEDRDLSGEGGGTPSIGVIAILAALVGAVALLARRRRE